MKRTPQPTLTQSKLTSMLQARADGPKTVTLEEVEMDTSSSAPEPRTSAPRLPAPEPGSLSSAGMVGPASGAAPSAANSAVTADFLLRALKENSEHLIKSFNASIAALSSKIDDNTGKISANTAAIAEQAAVSDDHQSQLRSLGDRVARLERAKPEREPMIEHRAPLSDCYVLARRSIRLWPIYGASEDALWEGVGEFIHDVLAVREADVGQEDIESIVRVIDGKDQAERKEVIVRFFTKQKRDLVVSNSPNLAGRVDRDGKPTAGIRMEVPPELEETFRLLHRFGTRLRSRHGAGTKRHIKFDDYGGSLYANIKLPGDSSWTRVTPSMAREDLGASLREENACTQKRLATKLIPGPRERLGRPMEEVRLALPARPRGPPQATVESACTVPNGKRPRWSVPDRRPL